MKVIYAPHDIDDTDYDVKVFLAGSIDMGEADNWQERIIGDLQHCKGIIFNPRRPDWDSSWEQNIDDPKFFEQVSWELNALEYSDIIFYHFSKYSKSPISLLELGLHAQSKLITRIVYCPDEFYRKGNVDIVCKKYGIPCTSSYERAFRLLESAIISTGCEYNCF